MKKVFVLGDSISIQYGPFLEQFLRGHLAYGRKEGEEEALADLDFPRGANGGDSRMVLAYLRKRGPDIRADYLLLNCGLHDLRVDPGTGCRQVPVEEYGENLVAILGQAGNLGLEPLWVRTTPCDEAVHNHPGMAFHRFSRDVEAYNAAADAVMAHHGVPVFDLFGFTRNLGGPEVFRDHVHFTEEVQKLQAAFLAGCLLDREPGAGQPR